MREACLVGRGVVEPSPSSLKAGGGWFTSCVAGSAKRSVELRRSGIAGTGARDLTVFSNFGVLRSVCVLPDELDVREWTCAGREIGC